MNQFIEQLRVCSLFHEIAEEDLPRLLDCLGASRRVYQKNAVILSAGDPVTDIGVVLEGRVQVISDDILGNRSILGTVERGRLFAEAFCCAGIDRLPVSVVAQSGSEALFLNYRRILTSCPSSCGFHGRLIENMVRILARKNLLLNQKILHLSKRSTRDKLFSYLSAEAQRAGGGSFTIPFNRQELADYLCVDRSAMSAEIGKLRKEGILFAHRNEFRFL